MLSIPILHSFIAIRDETHEKSLPHRQARSLKLPVVLNCARYPFESRWRVVLADLEFKAITITGICMESRWTHILPHVAPGRLLPQQLPASFRSTPMQIALFQESEGVRASHRALINYPTCPARYCPHSSVPGC